MSAPPCAPAAPAAKPFPAGRAGRLLALAALAVLLPAALFAARVIPADLAHFRAEKALALYRALRDREDPAAAEALATARLQSTRALSLLPDEPRYHFVAAQVAALTGWARWRAEGNRGALVAGYGEALRHLRRAAELRPTHPWTWALIAEYKAALGARDEEWYRARERALLLGGGNVRLVERMLAL
ncbi:MAG: hypothetical protein KatS3mg124_0697 [Porticoccaceae bacterium]|nr:MAG: hypothetical protein KatS3mg124_0697 [Porticoccaceae bacterium]